MPPRHSSLWPAEARPFCLRSDLNVVMYFIILATAATLFKAGQTDIQSATDAAQALKPLAGRGASILLAFGSECGDVLHHSGDGANTLQSGPDRYSVGHRCRPGTQASGRQRRVHSACVRI